MNRFYYGWINDQFVQQTNENFKKRGSKLTIPCFRLSDAVSWWSEDYRGFFSRGFVFKDSSITYKRVENWLEYQDGKRASILSELPLTQGTFNS